MKKYTFFVFAFFILISSCKKEAGTESLTTSPISLDDSFTISEGTFVYSSNKNSGGVVKIYKQKDGKYVLALEQMSLSGNADLEIYFSATASVSALSLKLFSGKDFNGTIYYELPGNINITDFDFVLINNDRLAEPVASAELSW